MVIPNLQRRLLRTRLEPMAALTLAWHTRHILVHGGAGWALLRSRSAVPRRVPIPAERGDLAGGMNVDDDRKPLRH